MNPIKTLAPCTRLPSKLPKSFWPRNSPCCTSRFANVCAQGSGLWPSLDWVCLVWLRPCVKLEIPIGLCAGCTGKPHKLANMCATDTRSAKTMTTTTKRTMRTTTMSASHCLSEGRRRVQREFRRGMPCVLDLSAWEFRTDIWENSAWKNRKQDHFLLAPTCGRTHLSSPKLRQVDLSKGLRQYRTAFNC